ncbi:hypothetical protein E6O75_ATG02150 [Venturia nashicola]|uniref:Uncharacterized protein n=1 Tax=Venturia nashicola TaxID=86259 RepID=A0A4Z1PCY8_9PEZI|nr:hypothetical protein E6O75_ATG02150 [Venturia nashicola]
MNKRLPFTPGALLGALSGFSTVAAESSTAQSTGSTSKTIPTTILAVFEGVTSDPTNGNTVSSTSAGGTQVSAALLPGGKSLVWTNPTDPTQAYKIPAHLQKAGLKDAGGAAAGLAVGMLIAGALIAALVCFLLSSRKKKHNAAQAGHYRPTGYADDHDLKHPEKITSAPMTAVGAAAIIENNLPQPKEDNAISGDLSRIKSRIEGHVDSYYHTAGANNQAVAQALSAALGAAFPISGPKLQECLSNPRRRPAILRAAIAWIVVSRIDFGNGPDTTFLPTHVAGATRDVSASRMDEPTRVAFLSKWRQITAALTGNTFTQDIPGDDARLVNINSALHLADTFLRPCAKDGDDEKRLINLEEIMKRAARFGFLLFSQPSSFHFDWTDNGSGLVVFPGLLQVTDENGKPVASPRTFGSKEVIPM